MSRSESGLLLCNVMRALPVSRDVVSFNDTSMT